MFRGSHALAEIKTLHKFWPKVVNEFPVHLSNIAFWKKMELPEMIYQMIGPQQQQQQQQ